MITFEELPFDGKLKLAREQVMRWRRVLQSLMEEQAARTPEERAALSSERRQVHRHWEMRYIVDTADIEEPVDDREFMDVTEPA